jgi:hypothetical protein
MTGVALSILSCGKPDQNVDRVPSASAPSPTAAPAGVVKAPCPADGLWHECSVLERLDRAGLAPRKDSTFVTETPLSQRGLLLHLGSAELEVFMYPDEASREADEAKLDKGQFVEPGQPYTMRHERTLIHSVNLLAILKSLRDQQRERVADAITAGAPQPVR